MVNCKPIDIRHRESMVKWKPTDILTETAWCIASLLTLITERAW